MTTKANEHEIFDYEHVWSLYCWIDCKHQFPEYPFQLQAASDWPGVRREVDVASHNVRQLGSLLFEMEVSLFWKRRGNPARLSGNLLSGPPQLPGAARASLLRRQGHSGQNRGPRRHSRPPRSASPARRANFKLHGLLCWAPSRIALWVVAGNYFLLLSNYSSQLCLAVAYQDIPIHTLFLAPTFGQFHSFSLKVF